MKTVVLVVNNREATAIIPEKTDFVNRTQIFTYTIWYEKSESLADLAHTSGVGWGERTSKYEIRWIWSAMDQPWKRRSRNHPLDEQRQSPL